MKDIHAGRMLEPGVLSTPKALAHVKRVIADLKPFSEWMKTYVAAGL
jgi:hypothetical protein